MYIYIYIYIIYIYFRYIIRKWYNRDIRIMAWTVNLPSEKLHFSRLFKVTYLTDTLLVEKDM